MIAIAPEVRIRRGALPRRALGQFVREACLVIPLRGAVSILLTTDEGIRELNRQYRRKNKPTDVLSFPAGDGGGQQLAGDLAISVDTAERQAGEFGHSLLLETEILLLHGLLHLAGHDHERDAGEMRAREIALRERFGLPLGLIERTAEAAR